MEVVRLATSADVPALESLLQVALERTPLVRRGDMYRHVERLRTPRERIEFCLQDDSAVALAATIDDVVLGFSLVRSESGLAVIEELFVEPDAREVGLGSALIATSVEWAISMGCHGVDIEVLPGDRSMKNACERAGLVARTLTMHRSLQNPDEPDSDVPPEA